MGLRLDAAVSDFRGAAPPRAGELSTAAETSSGPPASRQRTYAQAVTNPRYSIVLESADPRTTGDDIIKQVKSNVDIIGMGVAVSKVTKIRNQRVVISCPTQKERQSLQRAVGERCEKLSAVPTSEKLPQLRLIGLANDLTNES